MRLVKFWVFGSDSVNFGFEKLGQGIQLAIGSIAFAVAPPYSGLLVAAQHCECRCKTGVVHRLVINSQCLH